MITKFKIFENYDDILSSDTYKLFLKKLHQLLNEFINLEDNKKDNLYVYCTTSCIIENDEYLLFQCGTEENLRFAYPIPNRFIIAYQSDFESPIFNNLFNNLVILENHILKEIRKYIKIDMSDDDGIKFDVGEIEKMKNIKFDIEEIEMEIDANKYNL